MKVDFVIEENTDGSFTLYSEVETNFAGKAKNFVRKSDSKEILFDTIKSLEELYNAYL